MEDKQVSGECGHEARKQRRSIMKYGVSNLSSQRKFCPKPSQPSRRLPHPIQDGKIAASNPMFAVKKRKVHVAHILSLRLSTTEKIGTLCLHVSAQKDCMVEAHVHNL